MRRLCAFPVILCLLLFSGMSSTASANPADAQKTLEASVSRILNYLRNPGYANPSTRQGLNNSIKNEVYGIFDFGEFSQRTVGKHWKKFNPSQKQAFNDAFAALLFATYLDSFQGYNGEVISYNGLLTGSNGTRVEVKTSIKLKNGNTMAINYRMLPKGGTWRVYDVLIEGVSLVKNYRSQFGSILETATPEELTARVRERTQAVKNKK